MLTRYAANAVALPQASGKPIRVAYGSSGVPAQFIFQAPVTLTHADSTYQIPDATFGTTPPQRTYLIDTSAGTLDVKMPQNGLDGEIIVFKRKTVDGNQLRILPYDFLTVNIDGLTQFIDVNAALSCYAMQFSIATTPDGWWVL